MSYIVPMDKPIECHGCPFCDIYTYDCRLQLVQYETFEEQIQTCPLVACDDDNKEMEDDSYSNDDMTFCSYEGCTMKRCDRHVSHIHDKTRPHSYADFNECAWWNKGGAR